MFDLSNVPTPCYVLDEARLIQNLAVLDAVQERTGCKIIMALKGFAMFGVFPLIREHLRGVAASSLHEARLGYEEFGREVHVFAPAYREAEFDELLAYSNHLVFNSFSQWQRFKPRLTASRKQVSCGIRVNPEHSEVKVALYDPCAPFSRLGVTRKNFLEDDLEGITGLHFHTLCELNADSLARTLRAFEDKFGEFIPRMKWVNFGGGHHITRPDYDVDLLCELIADFKKRYPVEVYLEPGEAVVLNAGVLVASVLDIFHNQKDIAILDASAAAHAPDVLEMPYRPEIEGAGKRRGLSVQLSPGRPHLPGWRRFRRLFLSRPAAGGFTAGFHRYGPLHDGQEQYLQWRGAAGHRRPGRPQAYPYPAPVWLRRLPQPAFMKADRLAQPE